jgi:hypothetical protein
MEILEIRVAWAWRFEKAAMSHRDPFIVIRLFGRVSVSVWRREFSLSARLALLIHKLRISGALNQPS